MKNGFRLGFVAAVLSLAIVAPFTFAANDPIDAVATGAINNSAGPALTAQKTSAGFRTALAVLNKGDAAKAFELAEKLPSGVERRTLEWAAIYFSKGEIDYTAIQRFMADAPEFGATSVLRNRLEQSLVKAQPAAAEVLSALGEETPNNVEAQILLAKSLLAEGDEDRAATLARQIWTGDFLSQAQEKRVLNAFGPLLDREAHWQRAMHLMMHDRARGSERLLPFLTEAQKSLVEARAAVSRDEPDAKAKLDAVDPSMHTNPVFIFSRAQRARQLELWQTAVEWLNKAPADLPDAAEWWYERRTLIRKLLDVGEPKLAFEVADGYRNGPEARMVDAHFHAGWIALSFLNDAEAAKQHFTEMTVHTTLPDSISQANYWLGRANAKLGDAVAAQEAFDRAARFSTVYYGQLARAELGRAGVEIRPLPDATPNTAPFENNPVVQAIRLLAQNDETAKATTLLRQYGTDLQSGGELLLAAKLAQEIGAQHLAISIATAADQRGSPLDIFSFPSDALPDDARLAADRAAVYAIVRQESMFQVDAVSSAGARGLMQLMPGTAKDVARDVGVEYSSGRLVSDAGYNALLGSAYLGKQLDRYDGSLVLAAAAYNAGPGNANKWIRAYGDPRVGNVDPVIWIELIPFQETRTYVKRVLGNYLVYRERLGDTRMTLKQALRTIAE